MKKLVLLVIAFAIAPILNAQTPCSGGTAGGYDCNGMTLQSQLTIAQMGGQGYGGSNPAEAQDSWGWTDPVGGKEYALVAMNDQTAFVDISNPTAPIYVGKLDSHTSTSWWRDIKVHNNHAYIVSDNNGNHGMQIFDLTNLRNVPSPPANFSEDGWETWGNGGNKGVAHNIVINEDTGFAYIIGTTGYVNAGVVIFDLSNATNPSQVATIGTYGRCHDAQVVTYTGPDTDYTGREIMVGSFDGNDDVHIIDVTVKANITNITSFQYGDNYVTHQGWFTEDQRFFILGDEGDELGGIGNTRTLVYDMTDLDNPQLVYEHQGATAAIDHNGYVRGNRFYLANYRAGMRVLKVDDLYNGASPSMTEVEFFDTHPGSNSAAFHGAWNVYPFFPSGNIIVSDLDRGLFVLKDPNFDETPPTANCQNFTAILNKTTGSVTIDSSDIDDGSSDNIGITEMTISGQTTFTCADVGSTFNITLTVKDDYGYSDSCVATVTIAGEETIYQGGGTWSNGLPDVGSTAKISTTDYDTSALGNGSFSACSCEVDINRTLTVGADDFIEIENDIIVDGTLLVKHTGNVVQRMADAEVVKGSSATINVELTTPVLQTRDFMVMGSPMDDETRNDVFTNAFLVLNHNPGNFIPHPNVPGGTNFADDNGDYWTSYTGAINVGEGYIVRPQSGYSDPANVAYNMTYTEGTLNSGNISRPTLFNNLVDNPDGTPNTYANPYASAMSGFDFINQNPLVNEIYFWEHLTAPSIANIPGATNLKFSMGDISMYNMSGGTKASNDPGTSTIPNGVISTGQGFAMRTQAAGNVTFNNDMRLTSGNTTLRAPNEDDIDKIWLNIKSVSYEIESNTLIAFNPETSDAIEPGYDSDRVGSFVSLYTYHVATQSELGIQTTSAFDPAMKFTLGFATEVKESTEYEISIDQVVGQRIENAKVFLYDFKEEITTELTETNYIFKTNSTNTTDRFTVFFMVDEVLGPNDELLGNVIVYPNPAKNIVNILSSKEPLKSIEIYDLRGRLINENIDKETTSTSINIGNLKTGVYFVKVFTESGSITKKLIKE